MSSFIRYAAVAAVVISLGFLVAAAPAPTYTSIPNVTGKDAVSIVIAEACVGLEAKIKALLACTSTIELEAAFKVIFVTLQGCADALLKIGAGVVVDAEAKSSIVACLSAIIKLSVQVCAQVSIKFGLTVVLTLFAQFDVVLRLCLFNLNICVEGILVLIAKACASVTVDLMIRAKLNLCFCLSLALPASASRSCTEVSTDFSDLSTLIFSAWLQSRVSVLYYYTP